LNTYYSRNNVIYRIQLESGETKNRSKELLLKYLDKEISIDQLVKWLGELGARVYCGSGLSYHWVKETIYSI
jgi:hypothetical protein